MAAISYGEEYRFGLAISRLTEYAKAAKNMTSCPGLLNDP